MRVILGTDWCNLTHQQSTGLHINKVFCILISQVNVVLILLYSGEVIEECMEWSPRERQTSHRKKIIYTFVEETKTCYCFALLPSSFLFCFSVKVSSSYLYLRFGLQKANNNFTLRSIRIWDNTQYVFTSRYLKKKTHNIHHLKTLKTLLTYPGPLN